MVNGVKNVIINVYLINLTVKQLSAKTPFIWICYTSVNYLFQLPHYNFEK